MRAIIDERQLTPAQEEEMELREVAPEKFEPEFDPELEFKINKKAADPVKTDGMRPYTREEVARLLAASNAPIEPTPAAPRKEYETLSREQVQALMTEHFAYLEREKKKKEEREQWDSQKTTGLGPKIVPPTKRTTSTKA